MIYGTQVVVSWHDTALGMANFVHCRVNYPWPVGTLATQFSVSTKNTSYTHAYIFLVTG